MINLFSKVHCIGIGGIGVSGIATILHSLGFKVTGSDISNNSNIERLQKLGIQIKIGHGAIDTDPDVVVHSSMISDNNPEIISARELKIPIISRPKMLYELMRFKHCIAVSGTHGKTTTTSLIGTILETASLDPTIISGGIINSYGTNAKLGKGNWLVAETDESDRSFKNIPSIFAVVTNIDNDHMEAYKDENHLVDSFRKFIDHVPFYGAAIVCIDDEKIRSMIKDIHNKRIITYGFSEDAMFKAKNYDSMSSFDLFINNEKAFHVSTSMIGTHNVLNCLASIAVAYKIGISENDIQKALQYFEGVKRRFTRIGSVLNSFAIIDDYAHHPSEIKVTLTAAKKIFKNIYPIFQPHRYSRLDRHIEDFVSVFGELDILVTKVYDAGEEKGLYDHEDILKRIPNSRFVTSAEDIIENISPEPEDCVIFLGAGDITKLAYDYSAKIHS
jgi:UDP-N-acetylmuramate--alanine ligase